MDVDRDEEGDVDVYGVLLTSTSGRTVLVSPSPSLSPSVKLLSMSSKENRILLPDLRLDLSPSLFKIPVFILIISTILLRWGDWRGDLRTIGLTPYSDGMPWE